ncbi:transcription elongation factor SPT4 [Pycnococcus provasolii]
MADDDAAPGSPPPGEQPEDDATPAAAAPAGDVPAAQQQQGAIAAAPRAAPAPGGATRRRATTQEEATRALASANIPDTFRKQKLRACMRCYLIKSSEQFYDQGCENCPFLHLEGDLTQVHDCTTTAFSGLLAITKPTETWAGKWVRVSHQKPGVYALSVTGALPEEIAQQVRDAGVRYEPREV